MTDNQTTKSRSIESFYQQIAKYFVNILLGNQALGNGMSCEVPSKLTGVDLDSHNLRPYIDTYLATKLRVDITRLVITINPTVRNTTVNGGTITEKYLVITAQVLAP
jgi:hypothetical protein